MHNAERHNQKKKKEREWVYVSFSLKEMWCKCTTAQSKMCMNNLHMTTKWLALWFVTVFVVVVRCSLFPYSQCQLKRSIVGVICGADCFPNGATWKCNHSNTLDFLLYSVVINFILIWPYDAYGYGYGYSTCFASSID